jgi:hypothetical protein
MKHAIQAVSGLSIHNLSCLLSSYPSFQAATGAHAIAVTTEWDEFSTLDYKLIYVSYLFLKVLFANLLHSNSRSNGINLDELTFL